MSDVLTTLSSGSSELISGLGEAIANIFNTIAAIFEPAPGDGDNELASDA